MNIRSIFTALGFLAAMTLSATAGSHGGKTGDADFDKILGKWSWEGIVVEVTACDATKICAKVVSGDSKCGGKMIHSMAKKDANTGNGDICHPKTGEVYKSVIKMDGPDKVTMTGTSASGATASGTFTRVK